MSEDRDARAGLILLRIVLVFMVVVLGLVWSSSYYGRVNVIEHLRDGCERGAKNSAATINVVRGDANGNKAVSEDPRQPAKTRTARLAEATLEAKEARGWDGRTPIGAAPFVIDARDRARIVKAGLTCERLYPIPPLISLPGT